MMIINSRTTIYFRHWFPNRMPISKLVFSNSTHYGFFCLGVIRYKAS